MSWIIGRVRTVTWSAVDLYYIDANDVPQADTIKIELSLNGGGAWSEVEASVPNTGSYQWTVTGPATIQAQLRFTGVVLSDVTFTTSDFTIEDEVLTTIGVGPGTTVIIPPGGTYDFDATGYNQDGEAMGATPVWTTDGGGTIDAATGEFTGGATAGGPWTITATDGAVIGTATLYVRAARNATSKIRIAITMGI